MLPYGDEFFVFINRKRAMMLLKKWMDGTVIEAGCDEVGRGCLCGPVVAAAVIIDRHFDLTLVNDSKKLSAKTRIELDALIREKVVDFAIAEVYPDYIDRHNILNASIHAMHLALDRLKIRPEMILVDGNRFHSYSDIPYKCIVKGDTKLFSIAAASILAKNHRDSLMLEQHEKYPQYGWNSNMGYPTKTHREAIRKYGITPLHRRSFKLL